MADDRRIMEMMEEMEAYFTERDILFKKREEAYEKRYEELVRRESSVKESEEALEKSQKDHQSRMEQLRGKEQELLVKDKELREKTDSREEEYRRLKKKLQEGQLRLNLLEAKLQNESLKQDADRLKYGSEMVERAKAQMPVLPCCIGPDMPDKSMFRTLEEDIARLKKEAEGLNDQVREETEKRETVEKEKQELLKILLETDPEIASLIEPGKATFSSAGTEESLPGSGGERREG